MVAFLELLSMKHTLFINKLGKFKGVLKPELWTSVSLVMNEWKMEEMVTRGQQQKYILIFFLGK